MATRELFISERRYITNVIRECAGVRLQDNIQVVREYYPPPRMISKSRFNNDYVLEFATDECLKSTTSKSYGAVILPNTLGVHVFVTVDEQTSQPLMTELLGGEAFSMTYFREHVEKIEGRLAELSHPITLRRASYCRIFVIGNDICFLVFPNDATPTVRGKRKLLCTGEASSIACCMEEETLIYVDGWIGTFVAENERKLEAMW